MKAVRITQPVLKVQPFCYKKFPALLFIFTFCKTPPTKNTGNYPLLPTSSPVFSCAELQYRANYWKTLRAISTDDQNILAVLRMKSKYYETDYV